MKRALITGVTGQDGAYLAKLLLERNYEVFGSSRSGPKADAWRLREVGVAKDVQLLGLDLRDSEALLRLIAELEPDEIYNLAAQSHAGESVRRPVETADADGMGALRLLESIRASGLQARFLQASSCAMYGDSTESPQAESTPFRPRNPYGISKLFAHWMVAAYRQIHGLFACSAILFNHESPLRSVDFVTRKITEAAARIRLGLGERLVLGNLNARRDWGWAPEFVDAMWRMLQQDRADDYVIATGESHTVRELVQAAFEAAGVALVWDGSDIEEKGIQPATGKVRVEVSRDLFRPAESSSAVGDPAKARQQLGWEPKCSFEQLVGRMVEADLERLRAAR